jgi:hypothetical protein
MALLKKNDPKRKWRSFKRHALLLIKTFFFSSATTFLWYEIWIHGYRFAEDDKDVIIGAIIMTFGVTYGISLSWIFSGLGETYKTVMVAVLQKDVRTLMMWRDERMPIAVHLSIGIPSLFLLGGIGAVSFRHALTGGISIFTVSFMLIFFWYVARELENPLKGAWFKERVDPSVFTQDVDDYFHLGKKAQKHHPHD